MTPQPPVLTLPPVLTRVARWMAGMMVASLVFTLVMTHVLGMDHPYGVLWIWKGYQWCDFFVFYDRSRHFMTPSYWDGRWGYPMTYPAPAAIVFGLFYKLAHPFRAYYAVIVLSILAWAVWLARGLASRGVRRDLAIGFTLVVLCSAFPLAYLLDTANLEGLMGILLACGVMALLRGHAWTAASLIGIAASLKLFPLILLALLFSLRRYREFAFGLFVMVALNFASLKLLGPSIGDAQYQIREGMRFLKVVYILADKRVDMNYSHALFNPIKFAVLLADRLLHNGGRAGGRVHELELMDKALRIYYVCSAALGLALYFGGIRKLPLLNQVTALTVCALLLTPFSSDYTLAHLLVPFTLLAFYATEAWREGREIPGVNAYFACLSFLLAWITFFTFGYSSNDFARVLVLIALLVVSLRIPLRWTELDGPDPCPAA